MRKRLMVVGLVCLAVAVVASVSLANVGDNGIVRTCYKGTWKPISTSASCKASEQTIDIYTKAGADAAFVGAGGKAADSDLLDGLDSTDFLGKTQKAADSDKLDGIDSTGFLGVNGKAADSDKLDGIDSTGFVKTGQVLTAGFIHIFPGASHNLAAVDGAKVVATCSAGPVAAVSIEDHDGSGHFATFTSDSKSLPNQAGLVSDGSPATIASTATVPDGGTYYVVGYSVTARAFSGSFWNYVGVDGSCNFQATALVDNSTPNVAGPVTADNRPAVKQ